MKHFWQMRAKLTKSKIVWWCRELWGREGNRWGATMSSTRLQRTMHFSQIELESVRLKPFSWFFFWGTSQSDAAPPSLASPSSGRAMSGFQSSFAEMLCDFCSYESKNRYENSGGEWIPKGSTHAVSISWKENYLKILFLGARLEKLELNIYFLITSVRKNYEHTVTW